MSRDDASLLDTLHFAREILGLSAGLTEDRFLADTTTQYAILYLFTFLGEAITRLSTTFRAQHPDIPWSAIAGMRNPLVHGYDKVNLNGVWITMTEDLPIFVATIEPVVRPEPE
jgi:uncharacterized protein with HEPN domain